MTCSYVRQAEVAPSRLQAPQVVHSRKVACCPSPPAALQHGTRSYIADFTMTPEAAMRQFDACQLRQCMGFQVRGGENT